jgi:exodeoxyribonuclease III
LTSSREPSRSPSEQHTPVPVAGKHLPGSLRVMTWNVQHASSGRAVRQADWIASQPADVVVLTEVAPTAGGRALDEALRGYGFTTSFPAVPGDYGAMIASRTGEQETCNEILPSYLRHRCVAIRLRGDGQVTGVVGLYVPSRGSRDRRNVDKRAFQDDITKLLPGLAEIIKPCCPTVIAGDLNVVEPGHQPHLKVFGAWEYEFYRAFSDAGYGDAFRYLHPELTDHSWYGRSSNGYRIDHIFCAPLTGITDCKYLHQPRLARLSDHSAMIATIACSTVSATHRR